MDKNSDKPLVLVTGVSGYLGSWVVTKLFESGKYRVRGTVRDHTNKEKMEVLKKGYGEYYDQIEFMSADLGDAEAIAKAVEGCDYVLHVASPIPFESPKDAEKEVIQPAINGNKHVLKACVGSTVKKVIITSSALTVQDFTKGDGSTSDHTTFVKEHEKMTAYYKSKIRAERYAYDFMDKLSSKERTFEMMTIHPSLILGKFIIPSTSGTIFKFFKETMEGTLPGFLKVYFGHSDVEDCALAHVNAIERGRDGQRYVLSSGTYKFAEFFKPIDDEYSPKGYNVTTNEINKSLVWIGSFFNADAAAFLTMWNIKANVDGSFAEKELGLKYKPLKQSVIEACESIIENKLVKEPNK